MKPLAALLLTLTACTTQHAAQPPAPKPKAHAKPLHDARGMALVDGNVIAYITTTTTPPVVAAVASEPVRSNIGILERIAQCESGGSYTARNSESSASGKYQFLTSTWRSFGDPRWPTAADAPPEVQEAAARRLYAALGTRPWNASKGCWG